jgi:hypothetical protein
MSHMGYRRVGWREGVMVASIKQRGACAGYQNLSKLMISRLGCCGVTLWI